MAVAQHGNGGTMAHALIDAAADLAERKARRDAEAAAHHARHAELLTEHAASPILIALLRAHEPVANAETGWMECKGCTPQYDSRYSVFEPAEGPCPAWALIERGGAQTQAADS